MARQPRRSSTNLADEIQTLLLRISDPAEDVVQAVQCALHRSPCVILYTKQQNKETVAQGRPVNVKHGTRCVMVKVGGRQKPKKGGNFNLLL